MRHTPLVLVVSVIGLAGCPSNPPADSGVDATAHDVQGTDSSDVQATPDIVTDDVQSDIATDMGTTDDVQDGGAAADADARCDPGTAPADLPMLTSTIVQLHDGGTFPTPSGGDPTGSWKSNHVTVYLPVGADSDGVIADMTNVMGTLWFDFEGMNYRADSEALANAMTTAGPRMLPLTLQATGTFTVDSGTGVISVMPTCSSGSIGPLPSYGFSRNSASSAQLFATVPAPIIGNTLFVFDLIPAT